MAVELETSSLTQTTKELKELITENIRKKAISALQFTNDIYDRASDFTSIGLDHIRTKAILSWSGFQQSLEYHVNTIYTLSMRYPPFGMFLLLTAAFSAMPIAFYLVFCVFTVVSTVFVSSLVVASLLSGGFLFLMTVCGTNALISFTIVALATAGFTAYGTMQLMMHQVTTSAGKPVDSEREE